METRTQSEGQTKEGERMNDRRSRQYLSTEELEKQDSSVLNFRDLKRVARSRFWAKTVSPKDEGDAIEGMPVDHLRLYVAGKHPDYS